ncbi:MAG TPA: siderophore-interacting protein [Mycobacterium sp.]|nr:siderophore-interacting protein [Mycobacterium sp.]
MADQGAGRGWQGAVLKLLGAGDYLLTVTGRREISPHYLRLSFDAGGLLDGRAAHPTMWIRMWFADGDKRHQRGYTLVDPDPVAGTVDIEFALHDGCDGVATRWARGAQPGDTVEATVLGSKFAIPEPPPAGYVIVGDSASLPAINSLLAAIGDAPARVFLEAGHPDDKELPVHRGGSVVWVDRKNGGEALVQAVSGVAFDGAEHFGWVACDNKTTRAVVKVLRDDYGMPRKSIKSQAYWMV